MCSLECTVPAEENGKTTNAAAAHVPRPCPLSVWEPGKPYKLFTKQPYDLCIWLPPPATPKDFSRSAAIPVVSWRKCVPPEQSSVLRNIPWYLPEVLDIDGTNFIAQVAQICYSPVTYTPSNFISITGYHKPDSVYHFRGHKLFTWPSLSCISNSSVRFQLQVSLSCLF
jgi:hypothetical protein